MAANRFKLISVSVGGAVLLLMLLASSFSLGVYVGEHGWTREGLSYSGPNAGKQPGVGNPQAPAGGFPNGPAQSGTQPAPFPAGLPAGRPNLIGRILRIQPQSLQVASADGPRAVLLTAETRFLEQDGSDIGLKDLQKGDAVAVYGVFAGDGGELRADFVIRLPPKE